MPSWNTYWRSPVWTTFLSLPLSVLAETNYTALPVLPNRAISERLPSLSIIIPARNEQANLSQLLPMLKCTKYPGEVEILVVNDHSSDQTVTVAQALGVKIINLEGGLPEGWLGKPYACHRGAQAAEGEWLLFTDADTKHSPSAAAACVDYALRNSLQGMSLFTRQECDHLLDRMALSTAYAGLFAGYGRKNRMLNGQYILIQRNVYLESGGFAAVRGHVLEDVALGNYLSAGGYRMRMLRGESSVTVNMYSSREQMVQGITRLSSEWLRYSGRGVIANGAFITAVASPLFILLGVLRGKIRPGWLLPSWGAASLATLPWYRRFGSARQSLLAPLGAFFIILTALWGIASRMMKRGVPWKGRKVIAQPSWRQ